MIHLVILGKAASKKNSSRIVRAGGKPDGVPFILPSRVSGAWNREALHQIRAQWRGAPLQGPVRVTYLFVRTDNMHEADLGNYVSAVDDALQAAGVIANDRNIVQSHANKVLERAGTARVEVWVASAVEGTV